MGLMNKLFLMGALSSGLAGTAQGAITYVLDTTAPPSPPPCSVSGSTFGNSMSCTASTAPVPQLTSVTGWANTGGNSSTNPNGTLQSAYVVSYGGGVGVTNRDGQTNQGCGSTGRCDPNEGTPSSLSAPEHAIDNNRTSITSSSQMFLAPSQYIYDSVLLEFADAITLTGVTIGWKNNTSSEFTNDSDITLLAFTGGGGGTPDLGGRTYAALTASNDWALIGHYEDLAVNNTRLVNGATDTSTPGTSSVASRFWLVGAYNPLVGLGGLPQWTTGNDYVKLLSVTGVEPRQPPSTVPEPGSVALLSLAAGALVVVRRLGRRGRPDTSQ